MKITSFAFAAGLAILPISAVAQDSAAEIRALAAEYANLPSVQLMFDDQFSPENMAATFKNGLPANVQITNEQLTRIGALLATGMESVRPKLTQVMIDGMGQGFSTDELGALIAFYESDLGASVMRKMTPFMQDAMGKIFPDLQAMQQAVMPEIIAIIQEGSQ